MQHNPRFLELVNNAKKNITEISPQDLKKLLDGKQSFTLIDVRESEEVSSGRIPKAIHLSKGVIERDIETIVPSSNLPIILYCRSGFRSVLVADTLQKMGFTNVLSLSNGYQGWVDNGLPLEK
jgi:rhodanese-related sulfurtransferase